MAIVAIVAPVVMVAQVVGGKFLVHIIDVEQKKYTPCVIPDIIIMHHAAWN